MNDGLGAPQSLLLLGGTSDIGLAVVRALADGPLRTVVPAGARTPSRTPRPTCARRG